MRGMESVVLLITEKVSLRASCIANWKAIRPGKEKPFELYDLSRDIEEQNNVAERYPEILQRMMQYAEEAHTPPRSGEIIDMSLGFKGHDSD